MLKFYVYNAATREYLISLTADSLAEAEAAAARNYNRRGLLTLRVSPKRLGAPWLTAARSVGAFSRAVLGE